MTRHLLPVLFLATALLACEHEPSNVPVDLPKADKPKGNVSLPTAPSASDYTIKEKNADGTLRILGMVEYKDKHLNKEVSLTGWISRVYPACDPKKAKKKGTTCVEPHLILKDSEDADVMIQAIGFDNEFMKKAKFEQGGTHVFQGTYKSMAQGFVATENGVFVVSAVDGKPLKDDSKKKR